MADDEWRPSDTDVTADVDKQDLPESTLSYFRARRPESITPMSVPTLRERLDSESPLVFQRDLHEYVSTIICEARQRDEPYRISMEFETTQHALMAEYAHAIPTVEVLEYMEEYDPLIELFAGNGYWASELRDIGADIEAFDANPPMETWTPVQKGTQDALLRHAENTKTVSLILCWPPIGPAAYESLLVARPDNVFFIGEHPSDGFKMMADEQFFKLLEGQYELVTTMPLPRFMGHMDSMYHYQRV